MVTGHIAELHSLLHFKAGEGHTTLASPRQGPHGSLGPKALLLPVLQGLWHLSRQSLSFINAEVGPG